MDEGRKKEIIERLRRHPGREEAPTNVRIAEAMKRLMGAGAVRFGIRADDVSPRAFSASDLAPPLARMIDHTALKPETSVDDIRKLCEEATTHGFAAVCLNPCYVAPAAEWLSHTDVVACTVIGFPLGANRPETKAFEAERAVRDGASEVDMVLNVGMLKSKEYDYVEADIASVVEAVRHRNVVTKVILETALLTDEEKVVACVLALNAGADFVKTSTGFSSGGATTADVALMRRVVGGEMGVKASGGIRSADEAREMIAHGASRIGASASVAIVKGLERRSGY